MNTFSLYWYWFDSKPHKASESFSSYRLSPQSLGLIESHNDEENQSDINDDRSTRNQQNNKNTSHNGELNREDLIDWEVNGKSLNGNCHSPRNIPALNLYGSDIEKTNSCHSSNNLNSLEYTAAGRDDVEIYSSVNKRRKCGVKQIFVWMFRIIVHLLLQSNSLRSDWIFAQSGIIIYRHENLSLEYCLKSVSLI